jgi:hypothetical protein
MGEEQRRFDRIRASFQVECQRYGALAETWRPVIALDLSAGGLAFQTEDLFQEGETLSLRFRLPGRNSPLELRGMVVRSQPLQGRIIRCAVEFAELTPDAQVEIDELVRFLKSRPAAE